MADEENVPEGEDAPPADEVTEDAPVVEDITPPAGVEDSMEPPTDSNFQPAIASSRHDVNRTLQSKKVQINPQAMTNESSFFRTYTPKLPEEPGDYIPILYAFRIKARRYDVKLNKVIAKPPPFHFLFDHTIAVLWTMFSGKSDKKSLGIDQMQWAIFFLQSIHDSRGFQPPGVQLALNALRDWLITAYASMSEVKPVYESQPGDFSKSVARSRRPFSVNYTQMSKRASKVKFEDSIPRAGSAGAEGGCYVDARIKAELEELKQLYGIDTDQDLCQKDVVDEIMQNWKTEQLEQIQKAVKTLQHINDLNTSLEGNASSDNMRNADLVKRMDELISGMNNK